MGFDWEDVILEQMIDSFLLVTKGGKRRGGRKRERELNR
tara:strand:+ start:550 stop:666 length:117 start_codon:yes stop_codon:yes gene_type:complete